MKGIALEQFVICLLLPAHLSLYYIFAKNTYFSIYRTPYEKNKDTCSVIITKCCLKYLYLGNINLAP